MAIDELPEALDLSLRLGEPIRRRLAALLRVCVVVTIDPLEALEVAVSVRCGLCSFASAGKPIVVTVAVDQCGADTQDELPHLSVELHFRQLAF